MLVLLAELLAALAGFALCSCGCCQLLLIACSKPPEARVSQPSKEIAVIYEEIVVPFTYGGCPAPLPAAPLAG